MKKRSKNSNHSLKEISKFKLYECAVQNPLWQVYELPKIHKKISGKFPESFREDFCGSGLVSVEWIKRSLKNTAIGIDLDRKVIDYALSENLKALTDLQKKRITFLKKNVLDPKIKKVDWIGVFNYSFYVFHKREELRSYFKAALKGLNKEGTLFLEMIGGEGFQEPYIDERIFNLAYNIETPLVTSKKHEKTHSMIWEQEQFDPITELNRYRIHFKLNNGEVIENAFQYHWRLWGIRQVRELLIEAGFKSTHLYLSLPNDEGEDSGVLKKCESLPKNFNSSVWMAYVVGVK